MDAGRTWRLLQSFQPAIRKYCRVGDLYTVGIDFSLFCGLSLISGCQNVCVGDCLPTLTFRLLIVSLHDQRGRELFRASFVRH